MRITKKPGAWICSNEKERQTRGRIKIHQGSKLYLNDGDEFEIELFNPTKKNVKADITIDGKSIGTGLILRSGERVYLECFPDNKKKFTFKTYEVEDTPESKEAISDNGVVSVKFYEEESKFYNTGSIKWDQPNWYPVKRWTPWDMNRNPYDVYYTTDINNTGICSSTGTFNNNFTLTTNTNSCNYVDVGDMLPKSFKSIDISSTIETGQVDGGSMSNQEFESVDMDFNYFELNEIKLQLLPMSQKPLEVSGFKTTKAKSKKKIETSDKLERLMKLKELLDLNLIDKSEFDILKSEII